MDKNQLFVERRNDGRYALMRGDSKHTLGRFDTQREAVDAGKKKEPGHAILVERVRDTTGGKRDKWRSV